MEEKKLISLCELQQMVGRVLDEAFPMPVWVTAEIAELKTNRSGHCYLELVEKDNPGPRAEYSEYTNGSESDFASCAVPKASARAVMWRGVWASLSAYFRGVTGSELSAGMKVLVKVMVSYHELYGFSLQINDIDPSYTLGEAQRQRQQTIARLQADGVFDMNREIGLPTVIQRIAVISSAGAAGWRDFRLELDRFPFRFEVELFEATMQGLATEESVIAALEAIAERAEEFDIVAIIRGGGSQSDLSAFDSYRLASHIAQFPLPVASGIGHDKDHSVVDMVSAVELKTPTAVAVWLGERMATFVAGLDELLEQVRMEAVGILERQQLRLERASRVLSIGAVEMTRRVELRLERLGAEIARQGGEYFLREKHRLANFEMVARERPRQLLSREGERLVAIERAVALRRPENILALGFAIVRRATEDKGGTTSGKAIFDAKALSDGQLLDITLAKGNVKAKTVK